MNNHGGPEAETRLRAAYAAFNARDIDAALALMTPDVDWPNGMEGGYVHGHDGIREYWSRQWTLVDPTVEPLGIQIESDGRRCVEVRQRVADLNGNLLADGIVYHVYRLQDSLIAAMEIREDVTSERPSS
jgi:hypothetical protein